MSSNFFSFESLGAELEAFIQTTIGTAVPVKKYGGTLFTVQPEVNESQFCGVFIYSRHVQISFSKGAQLKDTKGLLKGSGKLRRHVNFSSADDVDFAYLAKLLKAAARL